MSSAFQRDGQLSLVRGAGAGLASRLDLCPLREVPPKPADLLVVDMGGLVRAERTDLAAAPVAIEVVALAGSWCGHGQGPPWRLRMEGRRGLARRADGMILPPPAGSPPR